MNTSDLLKHIVQYAESLRLDVGQYPTSATVGTCLANIAIVGESPTTTELHSGKLFTTSGWSFLWEALSKNGINRNDVYCTHTVKRYVPHVKTKTLIKPNELELWKAVLLWELEQLPNLQYVLILGNSGLQAIVDRSGIDTWRGSVLNGTVGRNAVKAVPTYGALRMMLDPKSRLAFGMDIRKFAKVTRGEWIEHKVTSFINPSYSDAMDFINNLKKVGGKVAYDIEVINNETACIGLGNNTNNAMCINFKNADGHQFTLEQERNIRKNIAELFNMPDHVKLIAQNGMFDASWLWFKDKIRPAKHYFDTMLAHHVLYPPLPHSLGFLTVQYTTRPNYKEQKDTWKSVNDLNAFWHYNAQDVVNTYESAIKIEDELGRTGYKDFFFNHVMGVFPYLLQMCVGGIKIDVEKKAALKFEMEESISNILTELRQAIKDETGDPELEVNPSSPVQMSNLYFTKLKLVGRGTSTDEQNRDNMYKHPATSEGARKILRLVGQFAEEKKFLSTYVDSNFDDDGRMRCSYNQTGTQSAPGRLSSSGMLWKNAAGEETGTNLQNQPDRAQVMYMADPGYCFVYFDKSQAEARVVGWYAVIDQWIEDFEKARKDGKFDCHRSLAAAMFKIPYDEVPSFDRYDASKGHVIPPGKSNGDPTLRFIAKRCRHGLNYRMMPDRLASTTGLSIGEATNAFNIYHRTNPELKTWWLAVEREIKANKVIYNALGRPLPLLEPPSQEALKSIVAFKPQSTIGDATVKTIQACHEDPLWPREARMALNVHDALIALAPLHYAKRAASIMKKHAEAPLYIPGIDGKVRELIIPADLKISYPNEKGQHTWKNLKPLEL